MKVSTILLSLFLVLLLAVPHGDTAVDVVIGSGGVGAVNGVSYPTNPAVDTVPTVTATNTVSYRAVPDCDDSIGQHLNYDTATHTWTCGNSTRSVPAFVVFTNPPTTPTSIGPVDSNTTNEVRVADMSNTANVDAPLGSPFEGQRLTYSIYCTTARTLTYTTTSGGFAGEAGLNLPGKCIGGSYLILEFRWSAQSTRWALVSVSDRRPKTVAVGDVASISINTNTTELAVYALGAATQSGYTVNLNTAATPYDGQILRVRFTTSVGALAKSITWHSLFTGNAGIPLPTVTTGNGTQDEFGFSWNEAAGSWVMLATTQASLSARLRTCMMRIGDEADSALTDAQLGPSNGWCDIPKAAVIDEIVVRADAGTPSIIVHRRTGTTSTPLLSSALATAAAGGVACARASGTGTTGYSGVTCSMTLQNATISNGDYTLGLTSGTAGGTAKRVTIAIHYYYSS